MTPIEYICKKYNRDTNWASQFIAFAEQMLVHDSILETHCHASRDYYAKRACGVASCDSPEYAYLRGKSDAYAEMRMQFRNFARDLHEEYEQFINQEESENFTPWQ